MLKHKIDHLIALANLVKEEHEELHFIPADIIKEIVDVAYDIGAVSIRIEDLVDMERVKKFAEWQFKTGYTFAYLEHDFSAITNPWYDSTGRFTVNPLEEYGVEKFYRFYKNALNFLDNREKLAMYRIDIIDELKAEGLVFSDTI